MSSLYALNICSLNLKWDSRRKYHKTFFYKEEIKSVDKINTNKESTKNTINGIFENFKEEINGFQKKFYWIWENSKRCWKINSR